MTSPNNTAVAYSTAQQLITTAWNVLVAVVLVILVFGWTGGKLLVGRVVHRREGEGRRAEGPARGEETEKRAERAEGGGSSIVGAMTVRPPPRERMTSMASEPRPAFGGPRAGGPNFPGCGRSACWCRGSSTRSRLMVAAGILPGVHIDDFWGALLVAAIVAVLNAVVPPVLAALRLPLTLVFGFLLVLIADA